MKKMLLLILLALLMFVSCQNGTGKIENETKSTESVESTQVEEGLPFVADDLPDDLDLKGKEVKIFIGDYNNAYIDDMYSPELTGNRLSDAVYYVVKNVEDRLNVKLKYDYTTYTWDQMTAFQNKIISGILAGDNSFDIFFDVMNYSSNMIENKYFINLAETKYINLDKPWYNHTVLENMPDDNIYFLSGQFSLVNIKSAFAVYFNDNLYKSLGKNEDLYAVVDSGKWTLDKLEEVIKDVYSDLNGNGEPDSGDRFGLTFGDENKYLGFIKSLGMDIFVKKGGGYEFAWDNERALEVIAKLCPLINSNINVLSVKKHGGNNNTDFAVSSGGGNFTNKSFIEGNSLFTLSLVADAATIVPSIDFNHGLLPYPKLNEAQENYSIMLQRNCFVLMPTTVTDPDSASAVLEAISSESYRSLVPEYCEITLKTRYSYDDDVSRMFDLIINSIVYDPGEIYANLLGTPSMIIKEALRDNNPNWASKMVSIKNGLINKMDSVTELTY